MTAEDALRALLHSEAATLEPAGDGLSVIQMRIARRRKLRLIALPSAGVLALGVAATVFLVGGTRSDQLVIASGSTPSPTSSATADPVVLPATPYAGQALLDFSSSSKDEVVQRWLAQVGVQGAPEKHTCESCDVVGISVAGRHVGEAVLSRSFATGGIVYHLVGVTAAGMAITSPKDSEAITSPTTITGTLDQGVDESVLVRLVSQQGAALGQTSAPAGSAAPWAGSLSWSSTSWTSGALVATTASAKDGAITRLAAVPVTRGQPAPTFVGLKNGRVYLFSGSTGAVIKQLTFPSGDRLDETPTWNGSTLVWARTGRTGHCDSELDRLSNGSPSTVETHTSADFSAPAISPDGHALGYVSERCPSTPLTIDVTLEGGTVRHIATDSSVPTTLSDITDDGTVLVDETLIQDRGPTKPTDRFVIVRPTDASVSDGVELRAADGCRLGAATFDGSVPLAWESCLAGANRIVRFDAKGMRTSIGPSRRLDPVGSIGAMSAHDGQVLIATSTVDLYDVDGAFVKTLVADGSVSEPDW